MFVFVCVLVTENRIGLLVREQRRADAKHFIEYRNQPKCCGAETIPVACLHVDALLPYVTCGSSVQLVGSVKKYAIPAI